MTFYVDEPGKTPYDTLDDARFFFRELHYPCSWKKIKGGSGSTSGHICKEKDGLTYWVDGAKLNPAKKPKLIDHTGKPVAKMPIRYKFDEPYTINHLKLDSALAWYHAHAYNQDEHIINKIVGDYPPIPLGRVVKEGPTLYFMKMTGTVRHIVLPNGYFADSFTL